MKKQITLRIEEDILNQYKAMGRGYHARMHEALENGLYPNVKESVKVKILKPKKSKPEYQKHSFITDAVFEIPTDFLRNAMNSVSQSISVSDQFFRPMPKNIQLGKAKGVIKNG